MAEEAKKKRSRALGKLTLNINKLVPLLDDNAPPELVTPAYGKVQECWTVLEDSHDEYLEMIDEEDLEGAGGMAYLDKPGVDHSNVLVKYSAYLKGLDKTLTAAAAAQAKADILLESEKRSREAKERKDQEEVVRVEELRRQFDSLMKEVESEVGVFSLSLADLENSLEDASGEDRRVEWQKIVTEYDQLKVKYLKLSSMDPSRDVTGVGQKFQNDVEKVFLAKQKLILPLLKDTSPVVTSGTSGGSSGASSTRKETVKLPDFSGEEKTIPYLKYPIWKKEWEKVIGEYEPRWHSRILQDHLDEAARKKVVGFETNYEESMNRLDAYYGNPQKVIGCVMKEVTSPECIAEGDYGGLVEYSDVLENNNTRLANLGFEHELSNTTTMSLIVQKFPRVVGEAWNVHLVGKSQQEQIKPFPLFIDWVKSQRVVWERMVATSEVKFPGKSPGNRGISHYAGGNQDGNQGKGGQDKGGKKCHKCQKTGHLMRDCPKKDNPKNPKSTVKPPRKPPQVKKFWCALTQR